MLAAGAFLVAILIFALGLLAVLLKQIMDVTRHAPYEQRANDP
jgi:hypothetical protein